MYSWISTNFEAIIKVSLSTLFVFSILITLVRISGLRSFAKMSSIDFASTIAIGSILASTIMNDSPSILKGGIAVGCILLFQTLFSKLTLKFDWFDTIVSNKPLMLMDGENILYENLYKTNLSEGDLMAKLREANVIQMSEVKAVILETTGDISVLHGDNNKNVADLILKNVRLK